MTLAEKIVLERKQKGWSQEELAERLGVTRQSVSKWETGVAVPDLDKILLMSELFGVTTDYLLKEDYASAAPETASIRKLTRTEVTADIADRRAFAKHLAIGVVLCILSPVLLILLSGLADAADPPLSENTAAAIGLTVLFILVALAVVLLIIHGLRISKYQHVLSEIFILEPGAAALVQEFRQQYERRYITMIAAGVVMCICSAIPLVIAAILSAADTVILITVALMIVIVAPAVGLFVSAYTVWNTSQQLLQEGEYSVEQKNANEKGERFAAVYWPIVVAAYLAWSFISGDWHKTWVIWPIAALLFGGLSAIFNFKKN